MDKTCKEKTMRLEKTMTAEEILTQLQDCDHAGEFINQCRVAIEAYSLWEDSKISSTDALALLQKYEEWVANNSTPFLLAEAANAISILLESTPAAILLELSPADLACRIHEAAGNDLQNVLDNWSRGDF